MPGTFSKIPAVKAALETLLADQIVSPINPSGKVNVARGVIDPPQLEQIEIFESRTEREYRALRPQPHGVREQISITIRVTAMASAQITLGDAEDRMWAICDRIDELYRADIRLGLGFVDWTKLERGEQRFWRFDQYRGSVITITMTGACDFD